MAESMGAEDATISNTDAMEILGVEPGAGRSLLRAAYRRKIRALHPDISGDHSPAGQAAARDVLDAYRRLCRDVEQRNLDLESSPGAAEEPACPTAQTGIDRGPNTRLLQLAYAATLMFTVIILTSFFLIAFAQSGP